MRVQCKPNFGNVLASRLHMAEDSLWNQSRRFHIFHKVKSEYPRSKGRKIMMHPSHRQKFLSEFYAVEITNSLHNDLVLYGRFKLQTSFIGSRISFTCMHFYETCPSLRCTHDIQNITHTGSQVQIKILSWNPVQIPHQFLKPKPKFVHNLHVHFVMVFISQSWSMTH